MRRITLALIVMLSGAVTTASAFPVCWNAEPFIDVLRVNAEPTGDGAIPYALTAVRWRAPTLYQLGGTGSVAPSHPTPGSYTMSLLLQQPTPDFFGGNPSCVLTATLSLTTINGPWTMSCGYTAVPFTVSGTLTFVPCDAAPRLATTGRAAGE